MSEHGSVKSADTKFKINPHDFFVPVVVMVVLCILIVATFRDKEPDMQQAGVANTEQAEASATATTTVNSNQIKAVAVTGASTGTIDAATVSTQARPDEQAAAKEVTDVEDTADADVISPARTATMAAIDRAVANPANSTASTDNQATDNVAPSSAEAALGESSADTPFADKHQAPVSRQDQWHRLHQEAMLAQRAHMMKMLEYRAEVMKRIEQDRRDLYRNKHKGAQQRREHRERYRHRLEQARNGNEDRPI